MFNFLKKEIMNTPVDLKENSKNSIRMDEIELDNERFEKSVRSDLERLFSRCKALESLCYDFPANATIFQQFNMIEKKLEALEALVIKKNNILKVDIQKDKPFIPLVQTNRKVPKDKMIPKRKYTKKVKECQ